MPNRKPAPAPAHIPNLLEGSLGGRETIPAKVALACNGRGMTVTLFVGASRDLLCETRLLSDPMVAQLADLCVGTFGPGVTKEDVAEELLAHLEALQREDPE